MGRMGGKGRERGDGGHSTCGVDGHVDFEDVAEGAKDFAKVVFFDVFGEFFYDDLGLVLASKRGFNG
jgi:hypothetical protein